jgi:hypothetical protein
MLKMRNITVLAVVAIAVGTMMIPGANLVPAAFAGGHHHYHHHHHHHHHHAGTIENSGNVVQSIDQSNTITAHNSGDSGNANANDNTQVNDAHNNAEVDISNHHGGKIKDSGNVVQSIDQSNTITADNSGDSGNANANDNTQVNSASNNADVDIHNK